MGHVHDAQATRFGLTRKRVAHLAAARRISHTAIRGVYRFAGTPTDGARDELRATWLSLDPAAFARHRIEAVRSGGDAVVSYLSAAHLVHSLAVTSTGGPQLAGAPLLDFTVTQRRRSHRPQRLRFHVADRVERVVHDGLPVTTVPQTVADLYSYGVGEHVLGAVIRSVLITAATDARRLAEVLDPLTSAHGRDTLMSALAAVHAPDTLATGSELLFAAHAAEHKDVFFASADDHRDTRTLPSLV